MVGSETKQSAGARGWGGAVGTRVSLLQGEVVSGVDGSAGRATVRVC